MAKKPSASLAAFGRAVRQRRQELGMSQERLAHVARLDRSYVGGVERGERNVAYLNIRRLAAALGLTVSELVAQAERG